MSRKPKRRTILTPDPKSTKTFKITAKTPKPALQALIAAQKTANNFFYGQKNSNSLGEKLPVKTGFL
jgi:hypothetical protein